MMGVNSLPKTVTRQHSGCDLNPRPAPESGMQQSLQHRLPSHREQEERIDHFVVGGSSGLQQHLDNVHVPFLYSLRQWRAHLIVTLVDVSIGLTTQHDYKAN